MLKTETRKPLGVSGFLCNRVQNITFFTNRKAFLPLWHASIDSLQVQTCTRQLAGGIFIPNCLHRIKAGLFRRRKTFLIPLLLIPTWNLLNSTHEKYVYAFFLWPILEVSFRYLLATRLYTHKHVFRSFQSVLGPALKEHLCRLTQFDQLNI